MLATILSVVNLLLLGVLSFFLVRMKRRVVDFLENDIHNVLEDVALSAGEQINEGLKKTFADPNVKRAFTVLGKKSGEVRADDALRNKVADKIIGKYPSLNLILDQFDLTPVEGLQLMNDPLIGPLIQGAITKGLKAFNMGTSSSGEYRGKY